MDKNVATLVSLATLFDGPYTAFDLPAFSYQKRPGTLVGCHICHNARVTLYKDGDERICAKCKKKREENRNEA